MQHVHKHISQRFLYHITDLPDNFNKSDFLPWEATGIKLAQELPENSHTFV
jgi:hypothetical protein